MKHTKPSIMFFLPSLGGGGAEMHVLRVLNHGFWSRVTPRLVLARQGGAYEPALDKRIPLTHLLPRRIRSSALSMLLSALPLRSELRRTRPAVVCSFLHHTSAVASRALGPRRPGSPVFLAGLQNNLAQDFALPRSPQARWIQHEYRSAFARADHFVALSEGVARDMRSRFPQFGQPLTTIYNAGFDERVLLGGSDPCDVAVPAGHKLFVACGRLTAQKNYPLLLAAFAALEKTVPARLWILGQGELRGELETLARELGLAGKVRFLGFQSNPYKYMARADAFVLSSDWEGFGNVLTEAMALGVPVISTDCPFGPAEIITHGVNGLLVPVRSAEALAAAMARLCANEAFAGEIARAGKLRAQDFHAAQIARSYESLFEKLAGVAAAKSSAPQPAANACGAPP